MIYTFELSWVLLHINIQLGHLITLRKKWLLFEIRSYSSISLQGVRWSWGLCSDSKNVRTCKQLAFRWNCSHLLWSSMVCLWIHKCKLLAYLWLHSDQSQILRNSRVSASCNSHRVQVADNMWRYYGTVLAIDGYFQLYNESGDYQSMAQQELDKIRFRTYYGGRPVVRRIASLHNFAMESTFPFNDMDIIGFNR